MNSAWQFFDCITTTAKEVFAQKSHPLVDTFIDELIAYGFQYPEIKGSTTEWQVKVNPAHITNIGHGLRFIGMKPRWTKRLISALIINLKSGGIFVRDTDLIQKNISAPAQYRYRAGVQSDKAAPQNLSGLLQRNRRRRRIEGYLHQRLMKLSSRNDKLVYFFRKQSTSKAIACS